MIRSRRAFLKFLAGSPLFAGLPAFRLQALTDYVISNPAEAIDVFKALALGARAICIGRPYMWGVAAFGQAGVESVLAILRREFNLVMAECGKRFVTEIGQTSIVKVS